MKKNNVKPSFAKGYAPRDGRAIHQSLQQGMLANYHAPLGRTGLTAVDASSNSRNGTLSNTTWASGGDRGSIWNFAASRPRIAIPECVFSNSDPWTVSCTLRTAAADNHGRFIGEFNTTNNFLMLFGTTNAVRFDSESAFNEYTWAGVGPFTDWATYTLVAFGNDTIRLYKDGVSQGDDTSVNGSGWTMDSIGASHTNVATDFFGDVASVSIWDRAITSSEARLLASDTDAIVRLAPRQVAVKSPFIPYPYPVLPSMAGGMLT